MQFQYACHRDSRCCGRGSCTVDPPTASFGATSMEADEHSSGTRLAAPASVDRRTLLVVQAEARNDFERPSGHHRLAVDHSAVQPSADDRPISSMWVLMAMPQVADCRMRRNSSAERTVTGAEPTFGLPVHLETLADRARGYVPPRLVCGRCSWSPILHSNARGRSHAAERVLVDAFVAERAVQGLHEAILGGLAGRDVHTRRDCPPATAGSATHSDRSSGRARPARRHAAGSCTSLRSPRPGSASLS